MYVSPAVRSLCEHPVDGEDVTLLLRAEDEVGAVAERVRAAGGTVERERAFDTLEVTVAQDAVDDLIGIEGVASLETTDTLAMGPDGAGEDVRPEEG